VREYFNSRDNPPRILADYRSLLSPLNNLSIRCEIPFYWAGRWGFETIFRKIRCSLTLIAASPQMWNGLHNLRLLFSQCLSILLRSVFL